MHKAAGAVQQWQTRTHSVIDAKHLKSGPASITQVQSHSASSFTHVKGKQQTSQPCGLTKFSVISAEYHGYTYTACPKALCKGVLMRIHCFCSVTKNTFTTIISSLPA